MIVRVVSATSLSSDELGCWSEIQRSVPSLASPFFSPAFTSIVSAARDDVQVAILEDAGHAFGFFPFQRGPFGSGQPVGSILSDYHGVLALDDARWDAKELIRGCGLKTWEFHHVVGSQAPFARFARDRFDSLQIELSDGYEAYMQGVQATHGQSISRLRRKTRKLEREHGALRFTYHTDDPAALETLFRWKSDQYLKTGAVDILRQHWVREVLRRSHSTQTDRFAGVLSFVHVDGRPVAAHLGIRSGHVCHSWFQAYDPEFAPYSPGLTLLLRLVEHAPEANITTIDLGGGGYDFKRMLTNRAVALAAGSVELASFAAGAARVRRSARSLVRGTSMAPRLRRLLRGLPRRR
jgi:CelD/BcsL family acetyltransferase involved in cellulose biosynthesis